MKLRGLVLIVLVCRVRARGSVGTSGRGRGRHRLRARLRYLAPRLSGRVLVALRGRHHGHPGPGRGVRRPTGRSQPHSPPGVHLCHLRSRLRGMDGVVSIPYPPGDGGWFVEFTGGVLRIYKDNANAANYDNRGTFSNGEVLFEADCYDARLRLPPWDRPMPQRPFQGRHPVRSGEQGRRRGTRARWIGRSTPRRCPQISPRWGTGDSSPERSRSTSRSAWNPPHGDASRPSTTTDLRAPPELAALGGGVRRRRKIARRRPSPPPEDFRRFRMVKNPYL